MEYENEFVTNSIDGQTKLNALLFQIRKILKSNLNFIGGYMK